jgi:hypothetical protein
MSQQNGPAPQRRSIWSRIASGISWDVAAALFGACLAYELGHAQGFKEGVAQMWGAEMAILHALTDKNDNDAVTSDL